MTAAHSTGRYLLVFAALVVLTLATVGAAQVDLGGANVGVALAIAGFKATLVLLFFMLSTSLDVTVLADGCRSIIVTSALASEGKSTTAANLAVAFARWQERIAELVRQAQAEGAVEPSLPAARVAGLLLHGWEGALMRARLERDIAPLADFLELGFPRLLA